MDRRPFLLLLFLLLTAAAHADVLAVATRGGSTISLVDPQTMQSLGTVGVGADPHEITIGPDGRHAYVSNYGGSNGTTISVVDLQSRTRVKDIALAPLFGVHGIVAANGKIWFTSERMRSIGRYDPATDKVDWIGRTDQEGSHMLAVRADGSVAYTGNVGSSTASIIPVSGAESAAKVHIPVVSAPEGIALSPDGRELWLGSVQFQGISVVDLATEKVVATIAPGTFAYRLTFSPDGRHVLVPRHGEVAVFDAAQRTLLRAIPVTGNPTSIIIAPDNRTAYVAATQPNQVLKLDFTTGTLLGSAPMPPPAVDGIAYATPETTPPPQPRRKRRAVTNWSCTPSAARRCSRPAKTRSRSPSPTRRWSAPAASTSPPSTPPRSGTSAPTARSTARRCTPSARDAIRSTAPRTRRAPPAAARRPSSTTTRSRR